MVDNRNLFLSFNMIVRKYLIRCICSFEKLSFAAAILANNHIDARGEIGVKVFESCEIFERE